MIKQIVNIRRSYSMYLHFQMLATSKLTHCLCSFVKLLNCCKLVCNSTLWSIAQIKMCSVISQMSTNNVLIYYTGRHRVRTFVIISRTLVIIPRILVIIPRTLVIIPQTLVTYLGHSSPISDTRHLSRTLVTYLGHSSPISDKFVYNTGKVNVLLISSSKTS